MTRKISAAIAVACVATSLSAVPSLAASPVKIGELTCEVTEYDDKLLKTDIVLECSYVDVNGNNAGTYTGKIDRVGIDAGTVKTEAFVWVVTTAGDPADAKIAGKYLGAAAGASAGAGAGANYLTGGFQGKISLQPLSAETKSGFGVSLAGQTLVLEEAQS